MGLGLGDGREMAALDPRDKAPPHERHRAGEFPGSSAAGGAAGSGGEGEGSSLLG